MPAHSSAAPSDVRAKVRNGMLVRIPYQLLEAHRLFVERQQRSSQECGVGGIEILAQEADGLGLEVETLFAQNWVSEAVEVVFLGFDDRLSHSVDGETCA